MLNQSQPKSQTLMSISTTLHPNYGFHTSLATKITGISLPSSDCTLHVLYTFPPIVFVDPYELDLYEEAYTYRYSGVRNLELPIMAVDRDRQGLLIVDILVPEANKNELELEVKVPLHFRYGVPQNDDGTGMERVVIPEPYVFRACPTEGT
jgi:hypothetical protein